MNLTTEQHEDVAVVRVQEARMVAFDAASYALIRDAVSLGTQ